MAIAGPSSYIRCTTEFLTQWTGVDAAFALEGLRLRIPQSPGAVGRADLLGWRDDLRRFAEGIEDQIVDREYVGGQIRGMRAGLHDRINQFNRKVRGVLNHTPFVRSLPRVPQENAGESRFLAALHEMNSLWRKIDRAVAGGEGVGVTAPMTLLGEYSQAEFEREVAGLREAYEQVLNCDQELRLARTRRNQVQEKVYDTLREYRGAVQGLFAESDPLVLTLPRLSPTPGATPDPVEAQAVWDGESGQAVITWTASENPNLDHYEVRYSPGKSYDADTETVVASVRSDEAREVLTLRGLAEPGAVAQYKVFVVLETGNERGSRIVAVARPEGASGTARDRAPAAPERSGSAAADVLNG